MGGGRRWFCDRSVVRALKFLQTKLKLLGAMFNPPPRAMSYEERVEAFLQEMREQAAQNAQSTDGTPL